MGKGVLKGVGELCGCLFLAEMEMNYGSWFMVQG